jgi:hypothetical protein
MRIGLSLGLSSPVVSVASFNPAVLPGTSATLLRWLDATNLTQGSGIVTAIDDKSANDVDPTINGSEEPTYTASEATLNNRPAWNCATGAARVIRYGTSHGITSTAFTIVLVGSADGPYVFAEANGNTFIYGQAGSGNKWGMRSGAGAIIASTQPATTPAVVAFVFNGASSKMYVSKKTSPHTDGSFSANDDLTGVNVFIGNGSSPSSGGAQNGKMTHFLIYSGAMSEADVGYLLDGFGTESGITIAA